MQVRTKGGAVIEAASADEVVLAMLDSARTFHADEWDYMEQVAERVRLWKGKDVDASSAAEFLASLQVAGLITIEVE